MDNRDGRLVLSQEDIAALCERHFGIGADGLMLVEASQSAHVKMVYYNSDGSHAAMCGNGIRCFAKFVFDGKIAGCREFDVETAAGIKHIQIIDDGEPVANQIRVDMGAAMFENLGLGMDDPIVDQLLETSLGTVLFSAASMGNPHAVIEVEDLEGYPVEKWGPVIETHEVFPEKANVNFTQLIDSQTCRVVTWERGAGLTLACGTGSCAAAAVLHRKGLVGDKVTVHIPGGTLNIELGDTVFMTGPAVWVFDGCIKAPEEVSR